MLVRGTTDEFDVRKSNFGDHTTLCKGHGAFGRRALRSTGDPRAVSDIEIAHYESVDSYKSRLPLFRVWADTATSTTRN